MPRGQQLPSDPTASDWLKGRIFAGNVLQYVGLAFLFIWILLGYRGVVKQIIGAMMPYGMSWLAVVFPLVPVSLHLTGLAIARLSASHLRELHAARGERSCITCGYFFEGLNSDGNCPECGQTYDNV